VGLGRWTPGTVVSDKAGNLTSTETGQPVAPPDGPAPKTEAKPAAAEPSEADPEFEAEMVRKADALRRLGASDEEIQRQTGVPGKAQPVRSRASIEAELAAIGKMRREDSRSYWKSEETQARERTLIAAQLRLQAGGNADAAAEGEGEQTGEAEPSAAEAKLNALQTELAEVQAKRKDAKGAERHKLDARELEILAEAQVIETGRYIGDDVAPELVQIWNKQGGVAHHVGVLAGMVQSINGALDDAGRDAFISDLEALPASVRNLTYQHFSVEGGSLKARLDAIEQALSGADLAAAKAFRAKHGDMLHRALVG
jgi:hypothetical protein